MTDKLAEVMRSAVRPIVTLSLVAAFVWRIAERDADGATAIAAPMGIVIGFWFKSREDMRNPSAPP